MSNPYQSPRTEENTPKRPWWLPQDIGWFTGRYLHVMGCVSVLSMAVGAIFFDRFVADLTCVFYFWTGAFLIRHNPTARQWVLGLFGLCLFFCIALLLFISVAGTESTTLNVGRQIENPPLGYVWLFMSCVILVFGIPFGLLLTQQAREEFTRVPRTKDREQMTS